MNFLRTEVLVYALLLGAGLLLLQLGSSIWYSAKPTPNRFKPWSAIFWSAITTAVGSGLALYATFLMLYDHKGFLLFMINGGATPPGGVPGVPGTGGAGASPLIFGMLAILMGLVTSWVVNLARKSVDDLKEGHNELNKLIIEHQAKMLSKHSTLALMQQRLLLLHLNGLELEALAANDETSGPKRALRSVLATLYARPSHIELMKYLGEVYDRRSAGELLNHEKAYIRAIWVHWSEYGEEGGRSREELVAMAEKVLNKL